MNDNKAENQMVYQKEDLEECQHIESLQYVLTPIELKIDNLNFEINQDKFQEGIDESSRLAGYITGLLNIGVSENFILEYLVNKETLEHNMKVTDKVHENNVVVAKIDKVTLEKLQL